MKFLVWISALALLPPSLAWVPPAGLSTRHLSSLKRTSTLAPRSQLYQTNSSLAEDGSEESVINQQQQDLERQRETAQDVLSEISALKNVVLTEALDSKLESYQQQVDQIETQVDTLESELVPPAGLTMKEYQATMALFLQLPIGIRVALCEALELEKSGKAATDLKRVPEIVTMLYQNRIQLTPQRLQDGLKNVKDRMKTTPKVIVSSNNDASSDVSSSSSLFGTSTSGTSEKDTNTILRGLLFDDAANKTDEELQRENTVKNILPRVARKEGVAATQADLDRLLKVLGNKDVFAVSTTEPIPGGYLIRGKRATEKMSGAELIQVIDAKLPEEYPAQVCLMGDVTSTDIVGAEMVGEKADPVLVLLNKDFTPEVSGILTALSSTFAIMAAFVFCVSVYGQNDLVASRLSEATAVSDVDGVTWFTSKVYDVLVPILTLQIVHEVGHFAVAKANKFEMAAPTAIPFFGLPFMGTKTNLVESPPNRNALFDFAVLGPLLGVVASLACFAYGLELTATADAAATQFFPALPVNLIEKSTLGGSMIDYFLGGGMVGYENRFITMQDANTPVSLHPLAIAGFTSMVMNALALLPLGSTDGGRLSQAIFGRYGHITISSFVWVALLFTAFTVERSDIIIAAWAINNIIQNDCEIPCRDETELVSFPRVVVAITLWFVTILALTPL